MTIIKQTLANILNSRDELSLRNIRRGLWPAVLIFPLTVIIGDLRYFDLHIELFSFKSYELMLFPLGLGWLLAALLPKQRILSALRAAAVCSAILLPFQIFMSGGIGRLAMFMALQLFNGLCAGCAFSVFCFTLNNIERLSGMALIQLYYGFNLTDMPQYAQAIAEAGQIEAESGVELSPREKEIFALMLKNFTLRQIGLELHISLNTVKTHYNRIRRKLGITNRGDLLLKFSGKEW